METSQRAPRAWFAAGCATLAFVAAASPACAAQTSDRESAWLALLRTWAGGVKPAQKVVTIAVSGSSPRLTVRLSLPPSAAGPQHFGDSLYGAYAFTYSGGRWRRVDTADFRATVATTLRPGGHVTIRLPVAKAATYRILVQSASKRAAWADSR
jgi:hypothetical protein